MAAQEQSFQLLLSKVVQSSGNNLVINLGTNRDSYSSTKGLTSKGLGACERPGLSHIGNEYDFMYHSEEQMLCGFTRCAWQATTTTKPPSSPPSNH